MRGLQMKFKDGNIRFDRELDHIGKKIICPSINDQTRAIKWRPTFRISKHCMFAGFIKEIFLIFDNHNLVLQIYSLLLAAPLLPELRTMVDADKTMFAKI